MFNEGVPSLSDIAAVTNDGFGGGNGILWLIIIFVLMFNGGGFGSRNASGVSDNYVLASDMANISRQIDTQTGELMRQTNQIGNGLCDGFYTQAQLVNGLGQNIASGFASAELARSNDAMRQMEQTFGVQQAISNCCCENRSAIAGLQNAMQSGFCTTNFNAQSNTRDIIDGQNANTQAILAKLCELENNAKDDKIATLTAQNQSLQLAASQSAQNNYLINQLRPAPVPCFPASNMYPYFSGTTIS